MLTFKNTIDDADPTDSEDIDLDKNIRTMSYARNMRREVSIQDSLVPIQENSIYVPINAIQPLKQGKYHSWERYFVEGQALVRKVSRRDESNVVQSFVDGLFAPLKRKQCTEWLDTNGWTWDSVDAFGLIATPSIPTHGETTDLNKTGQRRIPIGPSQVEAQVEEFQEAVATNIRTHGSKEATQPVEAKASRRTSEPRRSQRIRELEDSLKSSVRPASMQRSTTTTVKKIPAKTQKPTTAPTRQPSERTKSLLSPNKIPAVSQADSGNGKSKSNGSPQRKSTNQRSIQASKPPQAKAKPASQQSGSKSKVVKRPQSKGRQASQRPSTPPRQTSPVQFPEDSIPRLVKRKSSVDRELYQKGGKRKRLMDDDGLPPLPDRPVKSMEKGGLKPWKRVRRLPLPPPPEIPIMPTSD